MNPEESRALSPNEEKALQRWLDSFEDPSMPAIEDGIGNYLNGEGVVQIVRGQSSGYSNNLLQAILDFDAAKHGASRE